MDELKSTINKFQEMRNDFEDTYDQIEDEE